MRTQQKLIVALALVLFTGSGSADSLVYVVTDKNQFGKVDLSTGAFHQIGTDTPGPQFDLVPGPNGTLFSLAASGNLESINTATGTTTVIGATGFGGNVGSLAEVGGTLYATDGNNNFYTVNATTGVAHLIGPTGIPPIVFKPSYPERRESLWRGAKAVRDFRHFQPPDFQRSLDYSSRSL